MTATAPFEIIAAPYDLYIAPVATAAPDVSQAPAVAWKLLGSLGSKNYDEDGVTVKHEQTLVEFTPVGLTAARKVFRTEESLTIAAKVVDVSAAQYAMILNGATTTAVTAGVMIGGATTVPLLQGPDVALFALLARSSQSAGGAGFNSQYFVPIAYQDNEPEVVYKKGDPAFLECEWKALWDATNGFGKYTSQTAASM